MFQSRKWPSVRRTAGVLGAVLSVSILAGCATPMVQARVKSFQQWPSDAVGATYRFVDATPGQANNLEYQAYQDTMRANLGPTGLVESMSGKNARFDVSFEYGTEQTRVMVRQPYDPYFYGGFGGFYGPRWGAGYWGPTWVDVPAVAYRNRLTVEIHDNARNGAEVYRSSAYIVSEQENLVRAMPYLAQAIFDDFPGNNGSEREVEYEVER